LPATHTGFDTALQKMNLIVQNVLTISASEGAVHSMAPSTSLLDLAGLHARLFFAQGVHAFPS